MRVFTISLPLNQGYLSTNLDYQPVIVFNRCKFFLCIIYLSIFNQVSSSLHNLIIKFVCYQGAGVCVKSHFRKAHLSIQSLSGKITVRKHAQLEQSMD